MQQVAWMQQTKPTNGNRQYTVQNIVFNAHKSACLVQMKEQIMHSTRSHWTLLELIRDQYLDLLQEERWLVSQWHRSFQSLPPHWMGHQMQHTSQNLCRTLWLAFHCTALCLLWPIRLEQFTAVCTYNAYNISLKIQLLFIFKHQV